MPKSKENITWTRRGNKFNCLLLTKEGECCEKALKTLVSLRSHQTRMHRMTMEEKNAFNKRNNEQKKIGKAKHSKISHLNMRNEKGKKPFKLEKKLNKNSVGYKLLKSLKGKNGVGNRCNRLSFGSVFFLYKLPKGKADPGIQKILKRDKTIKVQVFVSTSVSNKLCQSVKKYGSSPLLKLMDKGYSCYHQMFTFNNHQTTEKNKRDAYKWELFWQEVSINQGFYEEGQFRVKGQKLQMKDTSITLDDSEDDLAIEYASTKKLLFPFPLILVHGCEQSKVQQYFV